MTSLRKRALIFVTLLLALIGVAATFASRTVAAIEVNKLLDNELQQIAANAGTALAHDSLVPPVFQKMEMENRISVQKWSVDGTLIHENPIAERLPRQSTFGFSNIDYNGKSWRVFTVSDGKTIAQAAQRWSARNEIIDHTAAGAAVPFLAAFPVAWIAIIFAVDWLLQRLGRFSQSLADRSLEATDPLDLGDMPKEFAPIVHAINSLIERYRNAVDQQRHFVSDAAHELRTPLAALQLQIDNLGNQGVLTARNDIARELEAGIRRASAMVRQLLKLARLDGPSSANGAQALDLRETVLSAVSDFISVATKNGIEISMSVDNDVRISLHDIDFRVLVSNLIDNAIRYTPRGGNVEISIRRLESEICVEVLDNGVGIPDHALPRIFDRFYRAAPTDIEGTGLGLSIARRIAERNNIDLIIDNRADRRGVSARILITNDQA